MEKVSQSAAEAVEIGKVVPVGKAFDILLYAAAKERDKADGFFLFRRPACPARRMKLMERLEPDEGELDGMFAVVGLMKKVARGVGFRHEGIDEFGRAGGASQRCDIIAPVEIPFEVRAMADAEYEVGVDERRFEKRPECGGVGAEADAKIDVGGDHAEEGTFFRRGGQLARGTGGEGVPEKREGPGGVGRIAIRVMPGG